MRLKWRPQETTSLYVTHPNMLVGHATMHAESIVICSAVKYRECVGWFPKIVFSLRSFFETKHRLRKQRPLVFQSTFAWALVVAELHASRHPIWQRFTGKRFQRGLCAHDARRFGCSTLLWSVEYRNRSRWRHEFTGWSNLRD